VFSTLESMPVAVADEAEAMIDPVFVIVALLDPSVVEAATVVAALRDAML
jgi:hypothetical protein